MLEKIIVIRVPTEEIYLKLMSFLDTQNIHWASGTKSIFIPWSTITDTTLNKYIILREGRIYHSSDRSHYTNTDEYIIMDVETYLNRFDTIDYSKLPRRIKLRK